jgi:uncharacterized SAM-binding protein YcdF (DUF218 family)
MFLLKKIIGFLLMPVPVCLLLLCLGLLMTALKRRRSALLSIGCGLCILLLAGNRAASALLCASLESRYPPAPAVFDAASAAPFKRCEFIAVLGSGHGDAHGLAAGQRLSPSARARLMEGLRLALLLPDAKLIVSGPRMTVPGAAPGHEPDTHARVLTDAAVELGFNRDRIMELDTARDTAEETSALARIANGKPVALVTSAWHIPRAMRLADRAGLDAIACPSDYLGRNDLAQPLGTWFIWDADSLGNSTRAWREYIGLAWTSIVDRTRH